MPYALAHDESSRHVHFVQPVDQSPRLLKWDRLVCVSMNENRGRIAGGDVRHGRELAEQAEDGLPIRDERARTGLAINSVKLKLGSTGISRRQARAGCDEPPGCLIAERSGGRQRASGQLLLHWRPRQRVGTVKQNGGKTGQRAGHRAED